MQPVFLIYTDRRDQKSGRDSRIVSVNFHITDACNYRCKFCFARFNENVFILRAADINGIVSELKAQGTEKITFVGGEPLLHPDIGKILEHAKQIGLITTVVT